MRKGRLHCRKVTARHDSSPCCPGSGGAPAAAPAATKVVPCWTRPFTEPSHARIIASYYHYAGFDDDDISVVDVSPDGWVGQRDPMVVVQARKAPAGQMGSLEALA